MTSELLRKLEAKDLISRTVDAADTRASRLRVTERGGELAVRAVAAVEAVDAAFFQATPDPAALLAMPRPLAHRNGGRVQGDDLLIEYDTTDDGNHAHTVLRRPRSDFGDDVLAAHYAQAHP